MVCGRQWCLAWHLGPQYPGAKGKVVGPAFAHLELYWNIILYIIWRGRKKNERRNAFISEFPELPCDHFLLPAPTHHHASVHMQIAGQFEVLEGRNEKLSSCSHAESPQLLQTPLPPTVPIPQSP